MRQRRFAIIGITAALAAAGATGSALVWAAAAPADQPSSFVPIVPCRLMDTRPAPDNVGSRTTPLGPGDVHSTPVWATNGNCTIPNGATAVTMNVTIVNPTAASFLTVYPDNAARPLAASLNWVAGQAPTPNAVTTQLSADGRVAWFNLAGTVDLAVDVVGYYVPEAGGSPGPQGAPGPQGPAGAQGPQGPAGGGATLLGVYSAATYQLSNTGCAAGQLRLEVSNLWGASAFPDGPCQTMPVVTTSPDYQNATKFTVPLPGLPSGLWAEGTDRYSLSITNTERAVELDAARTLPPISGITTPSDLTPAALECDFASAAESGIGERALICRIRVHANGFFLNTPTLPFDTASFEAWNGLLSSSPATLYTIAAPN